MNKILSIIIVGYVFSLSAQDDMRYIDQKTIAQKALKKRMGPLRNEEAVNVITKKFETVTVKDEPLEESLVRPNMIPGFEEWCFLYSNERPIFHPDE